MTFGGTPCPALRGCLSKTLADTSNTIINNTTWDHTTLFDKLSKTIGPRLPLEDSIPLHAAKPIAINMPNHDKG